MTLPAWTPRKYHRSAIARELVVVPGKWWCMDRKALCLPTCHPRELNHYGCTEPMAKLFTIKELCGGAAAVLTELLNDKTVRTAKVVNINVAVTIARGIVEQLVLDNLFKMIHPEVQDCYDMHVLTHGEYAACTTQAAQDAWTDEQDTAIEAVLSPYQGIVTASWFGVAAVDTRLHMPAAKGQPDEVTALAKSFAKEAWRVLTHFMEQVGSDKYDVKIRQLTSDEILAAAGVQRDDIEALLRDKPDPTAEEVKQVEQQQAAELAETLATLKEYLEISGLDEVSAQALLVNALDDDDGLALSGLQQLGLGLEHRDSLQMYAMAAEGSAEDKAEALYELAKDNEAAEALGVMTDAEIAVAAVQSVALPNPSVAPGPTAPPPPPAAAPAPAPAPAANPQTAKGKRGTTTPQHGSIPPAAFKLLRDHMKEKDEDVATSIGCARQTYINYSKDTAKVHFNPDAAQRDALVKMIDKHLTGLQEARKLIAIP